MALRPFQSARQIFPGFRLVQPEFVFRHHKRRADKPHPRLSFFHENLPSSELLAKRNLSVRADDLDAGLGSESFHTYVRFRFLGVAQLITILVQHYCTNAL